MWKVVVNISTDTYRNCSMKCAFHVKFKKKAHLVPNTRVRDPGHARDCIPWLNPATDRRGLVASQTRARPSERILSTDLCATWRRASLCPNVLCILIRESDKSLFFHFLQPKRRNMNMKKQ